MQLTSFKKEARNLGVIINSELYFDSQVTKVLQFFRIKHNEQRLQLTQNATARVLTGSKRHEYITPVFTAHHWLPASHLVSEGDGAFICGPPALEDLRQGTSVSSFKFLETHFHRSAFLFSL